MRIISYYYSRVRASSDWLMDWRRAAAMYPPRQKNILTLLLLYYGYYCVYIVLLCTIARVYTVCTRRGAVRDVRGAAEKGVWGDKWELNRQTARARDSPRAVGAGVLVRGRRGWRTQRRYADPAAAGNLMFNDITLIGAVTRVDN